MKTFKKETESKESIRDYPDCSCIRVSNCIKIVGKEYVVFIFQEDCKSPSKWIEMERLMQQKNYCKIKTTEDSIEQKQLVDDSIQKIQIIALKKAKVILMILWLLLVSYFDRGNCWG